jgi:hypothetical protein
MDVMNKVRLIDFGNNCPDGKCVVGFFTSVGIPTGQEILLNNPDYTTPFDDLFRIRGTVGADGIWHWDGEGNPTDFQRNTVLRIDAWYDDESRATALLDA